MESKSLTEGYFKYLGKELIETKSDNIYEFEIPFPRPSGDSIILRIIQKANGDYLISDNGFMDAYLFGYGINLWKAREKNIRERVRFLIKRYNLVLNETPYLVIKAKEVDLYSKIYKMSNLINDIESLKLFAPPVQFKYFRTSVRVYFKEKRVSFKENPKNIEFTLSRNDFSFNLDFLLYNKNAYIKLITTERMIRYWALNFIKVKEYYSKQGENIELWTIFNDRAGIASDEIYKWFSESVDQVIGWNSDKEKLEKLI